MITRFSFTTIPWSQVAMVEDVIKALPIATASPFVVIITISSPTSMPDSNLSTPANKGAFQRFVRDHSCKAIKNTYFFSIFQLNS